MNSKILILSIAVIAVGLFAMPSTLSLFAGQHTFYNGSSVNCAKCHQDIINEVDLGGVHETITIQSGRAKCRVCHTTGTVDNVPIGKNASNVTAGFSGGYNYSSKTRSIGNDTQAHAAVTVECVSCHTQVPAELNGTNEAHTPFFQAMGSNNPDNKTNILKGANEACVGCHTHALLNITWRRSVGYNMTVNESTDGSYVISITSVNDSTKTTWSSGE